MENNNENGSQTGVKGIFSFSLLLLLIDLYEFTSTFTSVIHYHQIYSIEIFNECFKYQSIGQAAFALFGLFAAVSSCILSLSLTLSFDFFITKLLESFLYFNYIVFGPFLLGSCFLGGYYFNQFAYVCNSRLEQHLHLTMTISLFFSFIISVSITIIYAIVVNTSLLYNSVRFQGNGNIIIGKLFWFVIENRVRNTFNNEIVDNNPNNIQINNNIQRNQEDIINEELPNMV